MTKAPQSLLRDVDVVPLAKCVDGGIVVRGTITLKSSKIVANTVALDHSMKNCGNIIAMVAPNAWRGYESFSFVAGGVNSVCADSQ